MLSDSAFVMVSIAGLTGSPGVYYGTSKHAQIGLMRSISQTAPGCRINALCPGLVDTRAGIPPEFGQARAGVPLAWDPLASHLSQQV